MGAWFPARRRRVGVMGEDVAAAPVVVGSLRIARVEGVPPVMCCACAWVIEAGAWLRVERDAAGVIRVVFPLCDACAAVGAPLI